MQAPSLSQRMFECSRKMKHIQIVEALGLMPQSELFAMGIVLKLQHKNPDCPVSITEVATKLHISSPAVSRTFKHLEEKGYARRFPDISDRRTTLVMVTNAGKEALKEDMNKMSDFMTRALSHLKEDDLETFFALSDKIHQAIQTEIEHLKK